MATIAIGDVHGNSAALEDLLDRVASGLSSDDTVVFLGDYIDRGPDSKACIDRILDFRASSPATIVTLLGNHEDWLLRTLRDPTRHSWLLGMEAFDTIASYSRSAAIELRRAAEQAGAELLTAAVALPYDTFFSCVPNDHIVFFKTLVPYHRTADAIYAHGGLDPRIPSVEDQPVSALIWGSDDFQTSYEGSDRVVYGHWNNAVIDEDGWPKPCVRNRTIGIDTISHGVLTAFRLPDATIVQSQRYPVVGVAV